MGASADPLLRPAATVPAAAAPARTAFETAHLPRVLVLAYRFPPQGGGGVQRTLKFVKYLPLHGWVPVVHTVSNPYWPLHDATLLAEIPQFVKVYRTRTFEFERLGRTADGLLSTSGDRAAVPDRSDRRRAGDMTGRPRGRGLRRVFKSMADLVSRHLLIPDPQIAWVPGAFARSVRLVRRERISLVYSSSPPNSGQVLALLVKLATGRPWVADFRDEWTEGIRRKLSYRKSPFRGRVEAWLERLVVRHADHVVVTTEKAAEHFVQKYPFAHREKFSVITNGFDPADCVVASGERLLDARDFNLTLTGNIEAMFDAVPFLTALRGLLDEHPGARERMRVNLVGTRRGKYDAFIRDHDLDGTVRYISYVPHQVSLQYLAESDALFLCQIPVYESATTKLSGKLFEYLHMRKPILALTLPGLTSEILSRSGLGNIVDPSDVRGIQKALTDLYTRWAEGHGRPAGDEQYIATFDRTRQAERLAGLFDRLAGGRA